MENMVGFQNEFTQDQKAAIIFSLMTLVTKAESRNCANSKRQVEEVASMLNLQLDDPILDVTIARVYAWGNNKYIIKVLNSLSKSQKEWYVITAWSILIADGQAEGAEVRYVLETFEDIGITEHEFQRIFQKAKALMNRFGLG